ncbi:sortase [bacterium]|nr:sortase [bacterium]
MSSKLRRHLVLLTAFTAGAICLAMSLFPLVRGLYLNLSDKLQPVVIFPLNQDNFLASLHSGPKIVAEMVSTDAKQPVIVDELDYGNIANWFTAGSVQAQTQTEQTYLLNIDKLNIHHALVKVGGVQIDYNLVQFNTDATVGSFGAPVIFGHSMLRQFYNPRESNKERYKGIFSTIMTLEPGDEIQVVTDTVTYTYVVTELTTVQPDDDFILRQDPSRRQLKLVTCTPEGTRLRRGVVTAELQI